MERRNFMKASGMAAAVGAMFETLSPVLRAASPDGSLPNPTRVPGVEWTAEPKPDDVTSIQYPAMTKSVALVAQWIIEQLAARLPYPCVVADTMPLVEGQHGQWAGSGLRIGNSVMSDPPGAEEWQPKQTVVLCDQVGVVVIVPSHLSRERRESYDILSDAVREVPVMVADPLDVTKLAPVVAQLQDQIVEKRLNVFTGQILLPNVGGEVGPDCEAAATVVSRKLGLAVRVVRMCGREQLLLRVDLLGGVFPA